MPTLVLKNGRDKSVRNRHPWLFSGAINRIEGTLQSGDVVEIRAANGDWIGRGFYNPHSQIRARIFCWDESEPIGADFWRRRLERALAGRTNWQVADSTDAYRLAFGEADQMPGLIVDKYGEYLIVQCLTAGIDRRKGLIVEALVDMLQPAGIYERSDAAVRKQEGLPKTIGVLYGAIVDEPIVIQENGLKFLVDIKGGHKTGAYLDQRDNRRLICQPRYVAGKQILNVFSYSGSFGVYAAAADAAQVINIDSAYSALELAEKNYALNDLQRPQDEFICGDAFQILRDYRGQQRKFDAIILDPPKFAHAKRDVDRACRGYKDLNLLSMGMLKRGGLLAAFSCSGLISADLFQKVLFGAAVDAGKHVQIIRALRQAPDHPVALTFPQSAYLKGFLCQVW